ncbi:MAG: GH116 family glycosyl-hydrolase [Limisphaerales bacterium]
MKWERRQFLKTAGLAAAGFTLARRPLMAGPFDVDDWNQIIPADKKLHPDWVASLFARGTPTVYTKSRNELRYLGMPVGGIGCGTLYLGGDGRLWNWDLFNQKTEGVLPRRVKWSEVGMDFQTGDSAIRPRDGATYVKPAVQEDSQAIAQGFALRLARGGQSATRSLDANGWAEIRFTGQYPVGTVEYADPAWPLTVKLEAFSPFIPHHADDSGLPVTVFHFTVTNRSPEAATVGLAGWLQNATSFHSARPGDGRRANTTGVNEGATWVAMAFEPATAAVTDPRPDLPLEDFEKGYGAWKAEGVAFGSEPVSRAVVPPYQGDLGGEGDKVANSHASAPGSSIEEKDGQTGRLTRAPFRIQRKFLTFYVGGGRRDDAGLRLLVDGQIVRTATGHDGNRMRREAWNIGEFEGREAVIEIFDDAKGGWGNIGADHFVQTDAPKTETPIEQRPDFGTMALAVIGRGTANPELTGSPLAEAAFAPPTSPQAFGEKPVGTVVQEQTLAPGQSAEFRFVIAWHFPNTTLPCPDARTGNYYARRFSDASSVVKYVAAELPRLESLTRLWRDTWYDSTLPHWFLERTFVNTSTLATTTVHRFGSGRFWAWEGIGCCEGTCTHVWHYAQAMGRLFPELERDQRERVDFGVGVGFEAARGVVRHRAEGTGPAVDGQCGRILGVWREHQMSVDGEFLKRVWPQVKQATEYLIRHDRDGDGILDGAQENTLDAAWYGQIAWITSLAIAALRAAEEMARELGDPAFADRCRAQAEKARAAVESRLFNGEYFFQIADPTREKTLGTYEACHIDQVHGQSWAWQVNLGRVLDRGKTLSALKALWKYNFAPDVGPFRRKYTAGRPYALAGDAGLVMTTNPKRIPDVYGLSSWQIGYFNECMSGFEHQVASHMVAEGMVLEGLAVTRAIHDRYHAARRNPFNEIECSDHYARAMASYGTFLSACGFSSHGPQGRIGFAPRLTPEDFRTPFTAAGGWGTYSQKRVPGNQNHRLEVKHGQVRLRTLVVELPANASLRTVVVTVGNQNVSAEGRVAGSQVEIALATDAILVPGTVLEVDCQLSGD